MILDFGISPTWNLRTENYGRYDRERRPSWPQQSVCVTALSGSIAGHRETHFRHLGLLAMAGLAAEPIMVKQASKSEKTIGWDAGQGDSSSGSGLLDFSS